MLQVHGLVKRYGDTVALDGMTFDVQPGQMFGFVGPVFPRLVPVWFAAERFAIGLPPYHFWTCRSSRRHAQYRRERVFDRGRTHCHDVKRYRATKLYLGLIVPSAPSELTLPAAPVPVVMSRLPVVAKAKRSRRLPLSEREGDRVESHEGLHAHVRCPLHSAQRRADGSLGCRSPGGDEAQ